MYKYTYSLMRVFSAAGFDWDAGNHAKCQKHGLTTDDVEAVFRGDIRVAPDLAHSAKETRFIAVYRGWARRWAAADFHRFYFKTPGAGGFDPSDQRPLHAP